MPVSRVDERYMAAAIRLSRRHIGLTATNPSVATLIVTPDGIIAGRGVTARGGRPHAEPIALAEAGDQARGATAYVTLEPCAHHGRTPPCAEALITAGVARVVGGASDPDDRVSGRGYAMLRAAGIEVTENVLAAEAADAMAGYLIRSVNKRPEVILKLAVSSDGMIGRKGEGQVAITGAQARARAHLLRAQTHAILVGSGTALADDPELTCRLPGLEQRSPVRIVVGNVAGMHPGSKLLSSARQIPLWLATGGAMLSNGPDFSEYGARILASETFEGRVALPELLEDLASQGIMSVLVEGGANIASSFLTEELVDRIVLFTADMAIGDDGIRSPLQADTIPGKFELARGEKLGEDRCMEWVRKERF
ncbi:MAG: bifunctional diaminohydroxyphosphoribosylaminopyrimidine deaminase/5-amino-6-(5-phosphoribosylamino)uracil reductase RibD [Rhizobiaceae bacterium]